MTMIDENLMADIDKAAENGKQSLSEVVPPEDTSGEIQELKETIAFWIEKHGQQQDDELALCNLITENRDSLPVYFLYAVDEMFKKRQQFVIIDDGRREAFMKALAESAKDVSPIMPVKLNNPILSAAYGKQAILEEQLGLAKSQAKLWEQMAESANQTNRAMGIHLMRLERGVAEAVSLMKRHYHECADTELSDKELKDLVKKYPNGSEELTLNTRLFLRQWEK